MAEITTKYDLNQIKTLIENSNSAELSQLLADADAREMSFIISHLNDNERVDLINLLPPEEAAHIMEEIPDFFASDIISDLGAVKAAAILNEMESNEQVDLIMDLDEKDAEAILAEMDIVEAEDVRRLLEFEPDTAGGLMILEYITMLDRLTIDETVERLRAEQQIISEFRVKYIYVINENNEFLGIVRMQDLLVSDRDVTLATLLREAKTFNYQATLEELAGFFEAYDYLSVPVIDDNRKMLGIVLRRDVLKAASEKISMDHLETQGIVGGDELRTMPIWLRSRRRLSWLSVNILLNIIAASVIAFHQDTLSSVIALAVFLPIISDMSGCSGNQAVAVSMRELSLGTVRPREVLAVWGQELSVGLINGTVLGVLIALAALLWKGNIYLGAVAGGALALNTMVAVSLGGTLPLILKGMKIDPALASGPILTTITDMLGFFLTLTFASLVLHQLGGIG